MASTGSLAVGISGRVAPTGLHKPTGRADIAIGMLQRGTSSARPARTGRLVIPLSGKVVTVHGGLGRGQVRFAMSGKATALVVKKPKGRLSIAVMGKGAVNGNARRPTGRVTIAVSTKGTHGLSTRSSARGALPVVLAVRGSRAHVHSKITNFYARPPLQNPHDYAIEQEKLRHNDALTWLGEMTAWICLWSVRDFQKGLVERCSVCYLPLGAIADTYKQVPSQSCPNCYGTTFEGGVRAIVYRPGLWDQVRAKEEVEKRGLAVRQTARVNIPSDLEMRDNDFAVRADGTRWKIEQPVNQGIVTGFASVSDWKRTVGTYCESQLLDQTSIAYLIPVNLAYLNGNDGWIPQLPFPVSPPDLINGPLVVDA